MCGWRVFYENVDCFYNTSIAKECRGQWVDQIWPEANLRLIGDLDQGVKGMIKNIFYIGCDGLQATPSPAEEFKQASFTFPEHTSSEFESECIDEWRKMTMAYDKLRQAGERLLLCCDRNMKSCRAAAIVALVMGVLAKPQDRILTDLRTKALNWVDAFENFRGGAVFTSV